MCSIQMVSYNMLGTIFYETSFMCLMSCLVKVVLGNNIKCRSEIPLYSGKRPEK